MKFLISSYTWLLFDPPLLNLGHLLASRGHQVVAVGIGRRGTPPRETVVPGFEIRRVGFTANSRSSHVAGAGIAARYVVELSRVALSLKPDSYIAGNWNSFLASLVASRCHRAKLIYYQLEFNDRRDGILSRQSASARLTLRIERRCIKHASAIFSAEPNRSRLMAQDYALNQEPPYIYNAPRLASFPSARIERPAGDLRIVYAGSIGPRTGIPSLLGALGSHRAAAEIDIYGLIQVGYEHDFSEHLATAVAAGNRVRYMGTVPYASLPAILQLYQAALLFYRPSNLNEYYCSPCKLFEYMAAGLAVIASDLPGLRQIIDPPTRGLCVASNSPSEVIAAIGRFASNPTLAAAMGAAGHKSFLSNYNFETQAERLLQVLERES